MENIFPIRMRKYMSGLMHQWKDVQEIRMRCEKPLLIVIQGKEWMVDISDGIVQNSSKPFIVTYDDIQESMAYICQYSLYAYEDELRRGFITIRGGHRIGISGQVTLEHGKIQSVSHIGSLNIRVSHEVIGCGMAAFSKLWEDENPCHCLIVSPPGYGKTTLLRDFIRLFSDGFDGHIGCTVGIVDERSEIAACYMGIPQNQVGMRTDVLDHCPKALGVEMMVRTMSPKIIAFDELGNHTDMEAVRYAAHSGCYVITTFHGKKMEDIRMYNGMDLFERYIFLNDWSKKERISRILDQKGQVLYKAV